MTDHAFNRALIEASKQSRGNGDQGVVASRTRRKGIHLGRIVDADLGHFAQARLTRVAMHQLHQCALVGISRVGIDDLHAHRHLRHPLGQQEADHGAAHTPDQAEDRKLGVVHAVGRGVIAEAKEMHDGHQRAHHHKVEEQEETHSFHHCHSCFTPRGAEVGPRDF